MYTYTHPYARTHMYTQHMHTKTHMHIHVHAHVHTCELPYKTRGIQREFFFPVIGTSRKPIFIAS